MNSSEAEVPPVWTAETRRPFEGGQVTAAVGSKRPPCAAMAAPPIESTTSKAAAAARRARFTRHDLPAGDARRDGTPSCSGGRLPAAQSALTGRVPSRPTARQPRIAVARAKQTTRAEARRRYRQIAATPLDGEEGLDEGEPGPSAATASRGRGAADPARTGLIIYLLPAYTTVPLRW